MYQIKANKDFERNLKEEFCLDKLHSVRLIFLHLPASQDQPDDIFVASMNGDDKKWSKKAEDEGLELKDYPPSDEEDHEEMLKRIRTSLGHLATTQYYLYNNTQNEIDKKDYLIKSFHEIPKEKAEINEQLKNTKLAIMYEQALVVAK